MTPAQFRALALAIEDAVEAGHMGHPDFRIKGGRIFATLGYPDAEHAMVKLSPDDQAVFAAAKPAIFTPAKGAWGTGGATLIRLRAATQAAVREALASAAGNARAAKTRKR